MAVVTDRFAVELRFNQGQFDKALDMVIPKRINGRGTYEEIIKVRPAQKAIIASGMPKPKKFRLPSSYQC